MPWIAYYATPRLHDMEDPLEMGITYCALASAVAAAFTNLFGEIGVPNSREPEAVYNDYKKMLKRVPDDVKVRLHMGDVNERMRARAIGRIEGVLFAGAMLYAARIEGKDQVKRKRIVGITKAVVDIGLTGGLASTVAGLPIAAIATPIANHLAEAGASKLAEKIYPEKHWVDAMRLALTATKESRGTEASRFGNQPLQDQFLTGFESSVEFLERAFKFYDEDFKENSKIAKAARENPRLKTFLETLFDHRGIPNFIKRPALGGPKKKKNKK